MLVILLMMMLGAASALNHVEREMLDNPRTVPVQSIVSNLRSHWARVAPMWSWPCIFSCSSSPTPPPTPPPTSSSLSWGTCSSQGLAGQCIATSACSAQGGSSASGSCPGPSNIQCCTGVSASNWGTCSSGGVSGQCITTSACSSQGGYSSSGQCPGPSSVQCCTTSSSSNSGSSSASNSGSSSGGLYGIDLWQGTSTSNWQCLSKTYNYAVVRAFRSNGLYDVHACASLQKAVQGGFSSSNLDVYMFPCPTCSASPSQQVQTMITQLNRCSSSWSGRVWLDIEGSQYWFNNYQQNWNWLRSLVKACLSQATSCGIYSSQSQWVALFGSASKVDSTAAQLPVWYARYPNNQSPTLSDFQPFGGWSAPSMKQYAADATVCTLDVDLDFTAVLYR